MNVVDIMNLTLITSASATTALGILLVDSDSSSDSILAQYKRYL
jgi:hypothetical protein